MHHRAAVLGATSSSVCLLSLSFTSAIFPLRSSSESLAHSCLSTCGLTMPPCTSSAASKSLTPARGGVRVTQCSAHDGQQVQGGTQSWGQQRTWKLPVHDVVHRQRQARVWTLGRVTTPTLGGKGTSNSRVCVSAAQEQWQKQHGHTFKLCLRPT